MKNKHYFSPNDVHPYHEDYRNWHTPGGVPARLFETAADALEAAAEEDPEGPFLYCTHRNGWWVPGEDEQHPEVGEDRFFWGVADPQKNECNTFLNQFKVLTLDKSISPSEALFELVQWDWQREQLKGIQEISYLVDDAAVRWLLAGSPDYRVKIRYYYDPPDTPVDPEYEEYIRSALEDAFERLSGSDWRFAKSDCVVELLEGHSMPRITFDSGGEPLPGEEVDLIESVRQAIEDAEEIAWDEFCDDNKDDLEE